MPWPGGTASVVSGSGTVPHQAELSYETADGPTTRRRAYGNQAGLGPVVGPRGVADLAEVASHVEVPRSGIGDVGPLVEGPNDVYICGECVELCQSIIDQEKRRRGGSKSLVTHIPTPRQIKERLDQYVIGQSRAKKVLAEYEPWRNEIFEAWAERTGKRVLLVDL